jgi:predicted nucleic acid-binding protein
MPTKVVDASALGALVFDEPNAKRMAQELSDASLIAPSLLWYELASIGLKKIRNNPGQSVQLLAALGFAGRLSIELVTVNHIETVTLAQRTNLTIYDASYLWLAQKIGARLVTLDKQLLKVAKNG